MDLKEWEKLSPEEQQRRFAEEPKMDILGDCKCMRKVPKQAIEWALDYHLSDLKKEFKRWERIAQDSLLLVDASLIEKTRAHLRKEMDFYLDLRKEIIELPRCDEPAFEVQK